MAIIIGKDRSSGRPLPAKRKKSPTVKAQDVFFPLAAIHAAVFVPLSVFSMTTGSEMLPALVGAGHAFEMFFGFALALLAGYLLGPASNRDLVLLVAPWLGGRLAVLLGAGTSVIAILTIIYAFLLAWKVVPRFRHARKWRNRAITWILSAIFFMPLLWAVIAHKAWPALNPVPAAPLLLFALLMAFMGGRIIAPAAAGEFQRLGRTLESRIQPRIEGSIVVLGGVAFASLFLPVPELTAALVVTLSATILVRLLRWQLWVCWRRMDILAMGVGYAWLSAGLLAIGLSFFELLSFTAAVHLITIGALGTLSSSVMLQQHYLRKVKRKPGAFLVIAVVAFIAVSAVSRWLVASSEIERTTGLWLAATSWSLAFSLVALNLLRHRGTATI